MINMTAPIHKYRRCSLILGCIGLLFVPISLTNADQLKDFHEQGIDFAKHQSMKALESIDASHQNTILPLDDKDKTFNDKDAKKRTLSGHRSQSVLDFVETNEVNSNKGSLNDNERFLHDDQYEGNKTSSYTEVCVESAAPLEFAVTRTLNISETKQEQQVVETRVCFGHLETKKVKRGKGSQEVSRIRKSFSQDKSLKTYHVTWEDRGIWHRDLVKIRKTHVDNCSACDHFTVSKKITPERQVITEESWKYNNPKLLEVINSPECSLISRECLDDRPRDIAGQQLKRCFVEKLTYLWKPPRSSTCDFLRSELCDLKSSRCLKEGPFGCALWERTFTCYRELKKKKYDFGSPDLGIDDKLWDTEYEPNGNFGDVVTKLAVYREMDRDLKANENIDITGFKFFSGKNLRCFVNELKDITYDCCNRMGGFSNDLYLSKCDSEEVALFDMKERGQCHYIGAKDQTIMGAKTSKKHVYCCFASKLARVFQEKVRKELGIDWGSPEKPNCQGFKREQISQVDMRKLDLTEAFEDSKIDISERLERITKKLERGA